MNSRSLVFQKTIDYLSSEEAVKSIERDPYWPKWNSPWWHMQLLWEMGEARQIPSICVQTMVKAFKNFYWPSFPIRPEEYPQNVDIRRKVACMCAVGHMYQIFFATGVDVEREIPWMHDWLLKYQLPDGGVNCDEAVYLKAHPKSSIVSTLPILESILFCRKQDLKQNEMDFLNRGAQYLLRQKLFRRLSNNEVIDKNWLEIRFPRFYEYDFLRGFYFLVKWYELTDFAIPQGLTEEVRTLVQKQMTPEGIVLQRYNLFDKRSYNPNSDDSWAMGEASEFELFKEVSQKGQVCQPLTAQWLEIEKILRL